MFNFRLINTPDGNQIIDATLKTPYDSITPLEMMEYMEVDNILYSLDRQEKKKKKRKKRNLLWKLGNACGIL